MMSEDRTRATVRTVNRAGWLAVAGLLCAAVLAPAGVWAAPPVGGDSITICQATNANDNPYVQVTVSKSSLLNPAPGHGGPNDGPVWDATLKDQKISWGDIIPPFTVGDVSFSGQNWTEAGQAMFGTGCDALAPQVNASTAPSSAPSTEPSTAPSTEPSTAPSTEPSTGPEENLQTLPSTAPTAQPGGEVLAETSEPSTEPTGAVLAETGAPGVTLPPTDTMAGLGSVPGDGTMRTLLVAMAALLAAFLLAGRAPAVRRG